eukprot:5477260-Lingulodinium_polyedra.AAC.1
MLLPGVAALRRRPQTAATCARWPSAMMEATRGTVSSSTRSRSCMRSPSTCGTSGWRASGAFS